MPRPELVDWVRGRLMMDGVSAGTIAMGEGYHETMGTAVLRLTRRNEAIENAICEAAEVPARARKVLFPPKKDKANERRKAG